MGITEHEISTFLKLRHTARTPPRSTKPSFPASQTSNQMAYGGAEDEFAAKVIAGFPRPTLAHQIAAAVGRGPGGVTAKPL